MKTITVLVTNEIQDNKLLFNELEKELDKRLAEIKEKENISVFQICFGKDGCD